VIWIGYTTRYRDGGDKMKRVAETMAAESTGPVRCEAVESKAEFIAALRGLDAPLDALHLIAHSGMYGPMFGTTDWPEQLSPHEWRALAAEGAIRFSESGAAWFHSCRSARWFTPFFARTFEAPAYGYHWYTAFSRRPDRFAWEGPLHRPGAPLYVMGAPGRKSHGIPGSLSKYLLGRSESPRRFEPQGANGASYDEVAGLYAAVFEDIRIRRDEWRWLSPRIPDGARVLDLGCGNGALLDQLASRIASGVGVDASVGQLEQAAVRCEQHSHLTFHHSTQPRLPLPDNSIDVAVSLLSWRYLDWDPLLVELRRVLTPGGRLLIVDMAASPARPREIPRMLLDRATSLVGQPAHTRAALRRMVTDARWQTMLHHNPIRAEHEYRWYLESRFPGRTVEVLNVGLSSRILAFDTGPISGATLSEMQYP
jgi:ubiquinone/menaquinone biosynthesis C-methylase UbiE